MGTSSCCARNGSAHSENAITKINGRRILLVSFLLLSDHLHATEAAAAHSAPGATGHCAGTPVSTFQAILLPRRLRLRGSVHPARARAARQGLPVYGRGL